MLWLAGARAFASWSGWLEGRRKHPGRRLQPGEWFFYRRLTFADGLGSIPCNVIVGTAGIALASLAPLPFFAPIWFRWAEVTTKVESGRLVLRSQSGLSFTIAGFRMDAVQRQIEAARIRDATRLPN